MHSLGEVLLQCLWDPHTQEDTHGPTFKSPRPCISSSQLIVRYLPPPFPPLYLVSVRMSPHHWMPAFRVDAAAPWIADETGSITQRRPTHHPSRLTNHGP
ncbi:hypothetical protein FALCPG4_001489 [Fusarium falciforme]